MKSKGPYKTDFYSEQRSLVVVFLNINANVKGT